MVLFILLTSHNAQEIPIDMDVDATCTTNWSQLAWSCPFRRQAFMHRHPTNSSTLHTSGNHRRAATGGSVDRPRGLVRNQPGDRKAPIFWDHADLPNWIISIEAERSGDRTRRIGFGKALRIKQRRLHAIVKA